MARIENKKTESRDLPYWIIVNKKRGSVWQGSRDSPIFLTEAAAIAELKFQEAALKPGQRHRFVIERVDGSGSVIAANEQSKRSEIESLERSHSLPYKD